MIKNEKNDPRIVQSELKKTFKKIVKSEKHQDTLKIKSDSDTESISSQKNTFGSNLKKFSQKAE